VSPCSPASQRNGSVEQRYRPDAEWSDGRPSRGWASKLRAGFSDRQCFPLTICSPPRPFAKSFNAKTVVLSAYFVRLRHGAADLPRFQSQAKALGGLVGERPGYRSEPAIEVFDPTLAVGWWISRAWPHWSEFIVMAQALARQATIEADFLLPLERFSCLAAPVVVLTMTRTCSSVVRGRDRRMVLAFLSPFTLVGEAQAGRSF